MCAPCEALPVLGNAAPPALQPQPDGSFLRREADAQKFQEYCDGLGEECPLVPTRNTVKDKGKEALIIVAPPLGIGARFRICARKRPVWERELADGGVLTSSRDASVRVWRRGEAGFGAAKYREVQFISQGELRLADFKQLKRVHEAHTLNAPGDVLQRA